MGNFPFLANGEVNAGKIFSIKDIVRIIPALPDHSLRFLTGISLNGHFLFQRFSDCYIVFFHIGSFSSDNERRQILTIGAERNRVIVKVDDCRHQLLRAQRNAVPVFVTGVHDHWPDDITVIAQRQDSGRVISPFQTGADALVLNRKHGIKVSVPLHGIEALALCHNLGRLAGVQDSDNGINVVVLRAVLEQVILVRTVFQVVLKGTDQCLVGVLAGLALGTADGLNA